MMARRWGKTSGANIPNIHIYACVGCGTWHQPTKPAQCKACGRMDFQHFASKAEAKRYGELALELAHGIISDLQVQPRFHLHAGPRQNAAIQFTRIGAYVADFSYQRDGKLVVEDVKGGMDTPLSEWKRKHAEAEHGITIEVIRR